MSILKQTRQLRLYIVATCAVFIALVMPQTKCAHDCDAVPALRFKEKHVKYAAVVVLILLCVESATIIYIGYASHKPRARNRPVHSKLTTN
jgi:hypothetical protein